MSRTSPAGFFKLTLYMAAAVLINICCERLAANAADPAAKPPNGPPIVDPTPHRAPPTLLKMPLVSPDAAASFFANRKVRPSDVPALPFKSEPLDTRAQESRPRLVHALPDGATTPSGRPRADFAIKDPQNSPQGALPGSAHAKAP